MKKTIDQLVADKIFGLINRILSTRIKPDVTVETVTELTEQEIDGLIEHMGIEGIILDLDETLRTQMRDIPIHNQEWLDMIRTKLKVIIVSNGLDQKAEDFFRLKDINYIGFAYKPLKKNFLRACELMKLDPERVLVIGDDLFSDIYGGKRNKMKTALITGKVKDTER